MSDQKSNNKTAAIADVAKPGETPPSNTSKAIITKHKPVQDSMVKPEAEAKTEESKTAPVAKTPKLEIKPLDEAERAEPEPAPAETPAKIEEPEKDKPDQNTKHDEQSKPEVIDPDAESAKQAEHEANVQKIIDSKKYELPITTLEKRKSKRFVALGVVLALLLTLAWIDIALDAALIKIPGVKPVTHIFSN